MQLTQLAKTLLPKQKESGITASDLPDSILIEPHVTKALRSLSGYTNKKRGLFRKKSGSSGWEYELSVLYFIDAVYVTPPVTGNYQSVQFSHRFSANPEYSKDQNQIRFELQLDARKQKTPWYKREVIAKQQLQYGYIASFHTHPEVFLNESQSQFTFFSPQDMMALLRGASPLLGMIAGNHVWLAARTSASSMPDQNVLQHISRIELSGGISAMEQAVKETFPSFNMFVYSGSLGGRLRRL